jgi:hypothetical protein
MSFNYWYALNPELWKMPTQREQVAVLTKDNQVHLAFRTPITTLHMDPTDALMIAEALIKHARNLILQAKPIIEIPKVN